MQQFQRCFLTCISGTLAISLNAQTPRAYTIENVRWTVDNTWGTLRGTFVNEMPRPVYMVTMVFSLFDPSNAVVREFQIGPLSSLAPGARWSFAGITGTSHRSDTPAFENVAYAKVSRIVCFVTEANGQVNQVDLTPPADKIMSPEVIERNQLLMQHQVRQREKNLTSAVQKFRKTHPCPSTGKVAKNTRDCKGYTVAFLVDPEDGGTTMVSNLTWKQTTSAH